jgi:hypothetical protein
MPRLILAEWQEKPIGSYGGELLDLCPLYLLNQFLRCSRLHNQTKVLSRCSTHGRQPDAPRCPYRRLASTMGL